MRKIIGKPEIKGTRTYPKDPSREERTEQHVSAHHVSGAVGCIQATLFNRHRELSDWHDVHFPFFRQRDHRWSETEL